MSTGIGSDETSSSPTSGGGRAARVKRTGIALVHEGELILPAGGSEAQAEQVANDARQIIHYHFPVTIEHVPHEPPEPVEQVIDRYFQTAAEALKNADTPA